MRKTLLALSLSMSCSAQASDWDRTDSALLATQLTLTAIDWGQTRIIARNPDLWYERNPFLGEHPSVGRVDKYFAVTFLVTTGISIALPQKYRRWYLGSMIVYEAAFVFHNQQLGIRVDY